MCLILFPGSVVRSGLHSSDCLHRLRKVIPPSEACLVWPYKLVSEARLSNSPPQACLSLFSLREVAKPGHGLGSISLCRGDLYQGLCQVLVVQSLAKRPHLRQGMRLIQVASSLVVAVSPPVLLMLGGKGSVEIGTPDVL